MTDLEIAKSELYEDSLTLAIVKNGALIFGTKSHRISGFLDAIETCGESLQGASLADRVVGKAVALLCVYSKIKEVYAAVMSRKAHVVFRQSKIASHWNELVENVLDTTKTGMCPFEKAAEEISDPEEAYKTFKGILANLKERKP